MSVIEKLAQFTEADAIEIEEKIRSIENDIAAAITEAKAEIARLRSALWAINGLIGRKMDEAFFAKKASKGGVVRKTVLELIRTDGPMSINEICDKTGFSKSQVAVTITNATNILVRTGDMVSLKAGNEVPPKNESTPVRTQPQPAKTSSIEEAMFDVLTRKGPMPAGRIATAIGFAVLEVRKMAESHSWFSVASNGDISIAKAGKP